MLQHERTIQQASSIMRDVVRHSTRSFNVECNEVLRQAGFIQCEAQEADDEEGIPCPPSSAVSPEGGMELQLRGRPALCFETWSVDEETGHKVGFVGAHDIARNILYMKMRPDGSDDLQGSERPTKSAITALLDIADACRAKKLTIGLGVEHAGNADFLCSLLYLGFQVVPSRKSPLLNCALLLDLDIGYPAAEGWFSSTDGQGTCTGTSDCSTEAEEMLFAGAHESDCSGPEN